MSISAAQAATQTYSLASLGFEQDLQVRAPYVAATFEFPSPQLARKQSASAELFLTLHPQLHGDTAFFFYLNDRLIGSHSVKDLRGLRSIILKWTEDGNPQNVARVKIQAKPLLVGDWCKEYQQGTMLFSVHKNSFATFTYEAVSPRTAEDFFLNLQQSLFVVVPDGAPLEEFTPGAWAYGVLKKAFPHVKVQLVRAAELPQLPPAPRIWIGMDSRLPAYFKKAAAGITLVDSNTLLISSSELLTLQLLVQQLPDFKALEAVKGSKRISVESQDSPWGRAMEAVSIGSDVQQEGILAVPFSFTFYPAELQKTPEKLNIHLEGSYSVAGPGQATRMDVFFNNTLAYSSVLDQSGKLKRDISLIAPIELATQNRLNVRFVYPQDGAVCKLPGQVQSATIFPASYIGGTGQQKIERMSWGNVGLFFSKPGLLLIDEKLGANALKAAGEASYYINRQLPAGIYAFPRMSSLLQAGLQADGYTIIIGMTDNIPLVLQGSMDIAIGKDFAVSRKATQEKLLEYQTQLNAVIGRIGNENHVPVMILSANLDGGLLVEAIRWLSLPASRDFSIGNVFVYQTSRQLFAFNVRDRVSLVEPKAQKQQIWYMEYWETNRIWILLATGGAVGLSVILFLLRWIWLKRKREREEDEEDPRGGLFK